jgi:glycyl-tRNA synthetase
MRLSSYSSYASHKSYSQKADFPCACAAFAGMISGLMADPTTVAKMEKIVALCKRRGFIFQSSEIYGGLNGAWDYGPLGVELKRNLKDYWWKCMTQVRDDIVGFDGSILMNRAVWQASGHEATFSDPMVDCKTCKARFRADQLESSVCGQKPSKSPTTCGGELTEPRTFNLMFKTYVGPVQDELAITYLRPETAQAMFVQFKNVLEVSRKKLPFGIAQIGKAFRNEINPRNFTFRSREFEQMEVEFFVKPDTGFEWLDKWLEERLAWYEAIGIPRAKIHVLTVPDADRAFYSKGTYDLEYEFPFGIQELEGIAYRTDYDLKQHQEHSGKPLEYFDEETKTKYIPHVVEPSAGVDRTVLAVLCEAYAEETVKDEESGKEETRVVLRFVPRLAPVKAGIFPLLKNKPELVAKTREVQKSLQPLMKVTYDEAGSIGKRYRRIDEEGTPFGVTVDFETLEGVKEASTSVVGAPISVGQKETVTLRHRDSMKQERIVISDLPAYLLARIS